MVAALLDELELRMPQRPLVEPGGAVEPGQSFYLARIRPSKGDDVELLFVGLDGRVYERTVAAVDGARAWPTASEIVALLQSLEPRCEPVHPEPATPRARPVDASPIDPPPEPPPAEARPSAPDWTIEPAVAAVATFGVAPVVGREGLAGYGGSLGLVGVSPSRVVLRIDVRILGARRADWWVMRVRTRAGAGYRWERKRLGLEISGGGSVEPWVLGRDASTAAIHDQDAQRRTPPLLGLWGHAAPFFAWTVGSGGASLALGPALEIAAGGAVDDGLRTVVLRRPSTGNTPIHRLGGLELSVAVTLRLRPGARGSRRAPR